ncbi:MAG TPA: hypothetical protein VGG56_13275 [Terracidiphilus sp.]
MEFEPMDDFERELSQAFERRPAPPGLKRRLRERGLLDGRRKSPVRRPFVSWQLLAASVALMAVLSGTLEWRYTEQLRKEEAARQEVLTALRITSHALNQMNARLAARHRAAAQD